MHIYISKYIKDIYIQTSIFFVDWVLQLFLMPL